MPKVTIRSGAGLRQEMDISGHHLIADEPLAAGGADAGPDPYGLLLAALGACTSMTLLLYARRKQWPLSHVVVERDHGRVHAEDCAQCEGKTGLVDRIERRITLRGSLDPAQAARLAEIARKCPVHKTLLAGVGVADQVQVRGAQEA